MKVENYALSGVWRHLKARRSALRSGAARHWGPDPDHCEKERRILRCLQEAANSPQRTAALFMDEMGCCRWAAPASEACPEAKRGGASNSQWRIVGAVNALDGRVHYLDAHIAGRRKMIEFHQLLDEAHPNVETLHLIQDNWPVHDHEDVLASLAETLRIEVVKLPTCAPRLNPIEKLWRWLRQAVLKTHRLAEDRRQLRQRVDQFLDQFQNGSRELLRYVGLLGEGRLVCP